MWHFTHAAAPTPRRVLAFQVAARVVGSLVLGLVAGDCFTASCAAESPRAGLRNLDWASAWSMSSDEQDLVQALKEPMIAGMDVAEALQLWFDGREAAAARDTAAAAAAWRAGLEKLHDLAPLPKAEWPPMPDAQLSVLHNLTYPDTDAVTCSIVGWEVDGLKQYGVLIVPQCSAADRQFPLLLYLHGAAYGVPLHALPWLADIARTGYVIIGPAMRGEKLFATYSRLPASISYKCEGEIENLDGEVNDALSAVSGAKKLSCVKPGQFGVIAHSFGAGAGLLVTARSADVACMVSYDAWLTNPFRYYWDRMRRGANNWLSWAEYCNQPVRDQLAGLMRRSIVHHAELINCPLLLFMGGDYAGSVFHLSHDDLLARLRRHGKTYDDDVVPGGGHNFVLYYESAPAKYAFPRHMAFLKKHLPPVSPTAAIPVAPPAAAEPAQAREK